MADAITTSGNIYQNSGENVLAAVKEAEYDLATRIHQDTDVLNNRIENGKDTLLSDAARNKDTLRSDAERNKDVIRSDVQRDKDYLSDKLTQEYIGGIQNAQAHADRLADRIAADDFRSETRFTTQTLAASLAAQNITAQANNIAATSTLAGSLASQNDTAQATQIANASTLAASSAFQQLTAQNQNLAAITWTAQTAAVAQANAVAAAGVLASNLLARDIATQAEATRALINHHYTTDIRDRLEREHDELIELRGDRRHCEQEFRRYDRDFNNLNQNALLSQFTSQINAVNSNLQNYHQAATQSNVSFGAGYVVGGASTNNIA